MRKERAPIHDGRSEIMATGSVTTGQVEMTTAPKGAIVLVARCLFALIFLLAAPNHFSKQTIAYAAVRGVPLPGIAVPVSGIIALVGGVSILLGYRAKLGAWLIVLFLVPVTVVMHKFWGITNPTMAQTQMTMFMKNVSMLGGALFISQFGAGPLSLDDWHSR
jgi:putative oxidoreductase